MRVTRRRNERQKRRKFNQIESSFADPPLARDLLFVASHQSEESDMHLCIRTWNLLPGLVGRNRCRIDFPIPL
jgi:hypothetical protein